MTRVLMIIDRYHPIWGGAENQLAAVSHLLKDRDIEVSILTRRWTKDLSEQEQNQGINITRVGPPGNATPFRNLCYVLAILQYVRANRSTIDLIHTHGAALLGAVGNLAASWINVPNVVKIATAGKIPPLHRTWSGSWGLKRLRTSSKVIVLSREIEQEVLEAGLTSDKIARIPNGVDLQRFTPADPQSRNSFRVDNGLDEDSLVLLFSGRLVKRKGLDLVIDSWPAISEAFPGSHCWILGSGAQQDDSVEEALKKRVMNEGLKHIHWLGETDTPESYMQASDLFVFPSRREGFSNTLLEAMACGLPVVASEIGGNTDVLQDEVHGVLFPSDDAHALTEKILHLLESPEKRTSLADAARQQVEEHYSLPSTASQLAELYRELT